MVSLVSSLLSPNLLLTTTSSVSLRALPALTEVSDFMNTVWILLHFYFSLKQKNATSKANKDSLTTPGVTVGIVGPGQDGIDGVTDGPGG